MEKSFMKWAPDCIPQSIASIRATMNTVLRKCEYELEYEVRNMNLYTFVYIM